MMLCDKYRPKSLDEVFGQGPAVRVLQSFGDDHGGKAYWITGKSGTGKTTLAYLIANAIADPLCVEEYDAGQITAAMVWEIDRRLAMRGLGKAGRAIIVNEAHGLRKDSIRGLLVALEHIPRHAVYVFTTTQAGERALFEEKIDASPLVSRCIPIRLSMSLDAAAQRVMRIAQAEGLDGQPFAAYLALAKKHDGNVRGMLSDVQGGAMLG